MKKLVHPNIVQLVEVIDAPLDSSLYMVMEYAERGAVMRCVEPGRGRYASPQSGTFYGFRFVSHVYHEALLTAPDGERDVSFGVGYGARYTLRGN